MCRATSNNLFLCYRMPQNAFFSKNLWSSGQPRNDAKTLFFHPLSPFPGNFCNCNSAGICNASQLYTVWSNAYSEIGPEVTLQLLVWKITKGIHSCKPASLNCLIGLAACNFILFFMLWSERSQIKHTLWRGEVGAANVAFYSICPLRC